MSGARLKADARLCDSPETPAAEEGVFLIEKLAALRKGGSNLFIGYGNLMRWKNGCRNCKRW